MTENIFPQPVPYSLKPEDQLYFLHLAKTGGRSLEDFLKKHFTSQETIRIDVEHGYPENIPSYVFNNYRLYSGHLGYHFVNLFPQNRKPFWITMLRNPVERVVSHYYFFRNMQPVNKGHIAYQHQVLASKLSLLDFVESSEMVNLVSNYQFNNLLDSKMNLIDAAETKSPLNTGFLSKSIKLVKDRLKDECMFFGITEHYSISLALICYTFNWEMPTQTLPKLNVTPDKPATNHLAQEAIEAIKKKLEFDLEIYNFACELFEQRVITMLNNLLAIRAGSDKTLIPIEINYAVNTSQVDGVLGEQEKDISRSLNLNAVLTKSSIYDLWVRLCNHFHLLQLNIGRRLGILTPPSLFDGEWYLKQYPDVAKAKIDPYVHYKMWGWKTGRNPNPKFDVSRYLSDNPEIMKAGIDPLEHYLNFSKRK